MITTGVINIGIVAAICVLEDWDVPAKDKDEISKENQNARVCGHHIPLFYFVWQFPCSHAKAHHFLHYIYFWYIFGIHIIAVMK